MAIITEADPQGAIAGAIEKSGARCALLLANEGRIAEDEARAVERSVDERTDGEAIGRQTTRHVQ